MKISSSLRWEITCETIGSNGFGAIHDFVQETTGKLMYNHNSYENISGQQMSNLAKPLWIPLASSYEVGRVLYSIKSLDTCFPSRSMAHFHVSGDILVMAVDGFRCMNEIGTEMLVLILWSLLLICYIHINMKTVWHRNISCITGPLTGESTSLLTKSQ